MLPTATTLMRLLEFTDSAFPVGTFSFSNGLETAASEGIVHDAASLEHYTEDIARQSAYTDGIAALQAYRACLRGDYAAICDTDKALLRCKLNTEARRMLCRMGKKLAELSVHIFPDTTISLWLDEIRQDNTPGTYPVAQGLLFASCALSERELFCSQQYGAMNMVLSAALRCVRVSHFDTQRILFRLSDKTEALYNDVRRLETDDMNAFVPMIDILASLHEKGLQRMFMN